MSVSFPSPLAETLPGRPATVAPGRPVGPAGEWRWPRWEPSPPASRPQPCAAGPRVLALARARRLARGGRPVWWWCLALFVLAQIPLAVAVDYWHPPMMDSAQYWKWDRLQELMAANPDRPLLVMLGTSRTQTAFRAGLLQDIPGPGGKPFLAFNFGFPMAGAIHNWLTLREMLDAGIRPRALIVEYLSPLLNEPRRPYISEELWTTAHWLTLPRLVRMAPYFKQPERKVRGWLCGRLVPWYVFRDHICNFVKAHLDSLPILREEHQHDAYGCLLSEHVINAGERTHRLGLSWGLYYPTLNNLRPGKGPTQAMRDLLELARQEKIPVAVVIMPESKTFRSWYSPEGLAESRRLLKEMTAPYGVPVIDTDGWIAEEDFKDGHHLQEKGARMFTLRLAEELRPFLAKIRDADRPAEVASTTPR